MYGARAWRFVIVEVASAVATAVLKMVDDKGPVLLSYKLIIIPDHFDRVYMQSLVVRWGRWGGSKLVSVGVAKMGERDARSVK